MSYDKLQQAFQNRTPYKYNKEVVFDGTKIIATEVRWSRKPNGHWFREHLADKIVLAEYVQHNGKSYSVVYNRGNKCFATEVLGAWRNKPPSLKYGEIGKPIARQQVSYRCQMIDSLIYSETITHILIPTTFEGDSLLFKKI